MNSTRQVTLFISTVTTEFRSYRDALALELRRPGVTVEVQEKFIATGTETLEKLDRYVINCDAIIHLVGDMIGAVADQRAIIPLKSTYKDISARLPEIAGALAGREKYSFTQWEAYLAVYHNKKLLIARPEATAPRDNTLSAPLEQRQAQEVHIQRLKRMGHYSEIVFKDQRDLIIQLLRSHLFDLFRDLPSKGDFNPYLANREAHFRSIRKTVGRHPFFRQTPGIEATKRQVNAFIIPARRHKDAPDQFISRLVRHDGPALPNGPGEIEISRQEGNQWVERSLMWPSGASVLEFADTFLEENLSRMVAGVAQGIKLRQPICFHTEFIAEEGGIGLTNQFIQAWLQFWEARFRVVAENASGRGPALDQPVLSFLMVDIGDHARRRTILSFSNKEEKMCRQIESFRPSKALELTNVNVEALTRLGNVTRQDALNWINAWVPKDAAPWVRHHVGQLENASAFPMTLQEFSIALLRGTVVPSGNQ